MKHKERLETKAITATTIGISLGAIIGYVICHPLTMFIENLYQNYFMSQGSMDSMDHMSPMNYMMSSNPSSYTFLEGITHSFTTDMAPMGIMYAILGGIGGGIYAHHKYKIKKTLMEKERLILEKDQLVIEKERLQKGFTDLLSHEIRTPMNALTSIKELLEDALQNGYDSEELINSFTYSARRLLRTTTEFIDTSLIESELFTINIHPVYAYSTINRVVSKLQEEATCKSVNIQTIFPEKDFLIRCDEYCLEKSLDHVLSNAIDFGGNKDITLRVQKYETHTEIQINNQGKEISSEYQKHLFERFSQEDVSMRRGHEGIGLGLYLTKQYLALMNSAIAVQSDEKTGTTVTLRIPLEAECVNAAG